MPNPTLRRLGARDAWLGLGATAVLTAIVFLAGVLPGTILELARSAAVDLLDPAPYIAATGLAGTAP
jgi:multicomponent Na+:H+ antiporter subunit D